MLATAFLIAIVARFVQSEIAATVRLVAVGCVAPALLVLGAMGGSKFSSYDPQTTNANPLRHRVRIADILGWFGDRMLPSIVLMERRNRAPSNQNALGFVR